jgi:hypothetical protein
MKKIIFLVLISFSFHVISQSNCADSTIRFIKQNKQIEKKVHVCKNPKSSKVLGDCPNELCEANSLIIKIVEHGELINKSGSPYFKICELYLGLPQIWEIFLDNKWQKTSFCLFKDASFVDNATLLLMSTKQ